MKLRRAQIPAVFAASFALALAVFPIALASGSSGEITRAEANADWTLGSIAGSATWSECAFEWMEFHPLSSDELTMRQEHCRLQAFVTVGPGSDPSDCSDRDRKWPGGDEQITLVWSSEETPYSGSGAFDEPVVPLAGGTEQLVCLSFRESYWERPECPPGMACPLYIVAVDNYSVLASASIAGPPISPPSPPLNTEPPHLSGTPAVGNALSCSDGAWEGASGFSRLWLRDDSPIAGQTQATYSVASADRGHSISCEVTATNAGGSTSARSNAVAVPAVPGSETADAQVSESSDDTADAVESIEPPLAQPLALRHRRLARGGSCGSLRRHRRCVRVNPAKAFSDRQR